MIVKESCESCKFSVERYPERGFCIGRGDMDNEG